MNLAGGSPLSYNKSQCKESCGRNITQGKSQQTFLFFPHVCGNKVRKCRVMKCFTFLMFCLLPWAQKSLYLITQSLWKSMKIITQSITLPAAVRRRESQKSLKSGYKKQTLHCKSTVSNVHYGPDLMQIRTDHRTQILLKALLWTGNKVTKMDSSRMTLTLIINL
jgi:hypothetical protein